MSDQGVLKLALGVFVLEVEKFEHERVHVAQKLFGDAFLPDFCLFFCGSNPYHTVPKDFLENKRPARNLRSGRALECLKLGAGVGFEPTTFRL